MTKLTNIMFDLTDKTALVVGGAGYLGREICSALAQFGAEVIIADLNQDACDGAVKQMKEQGIDASSLVIDITKEDSIKNAVESINQKYGKLDVLVNLACFSHGKSLEEATIDDWQDGLRATLSGAFALSREAGKMMIEQNSGSIIHFASMYGMVSPDPNMYESISNVNPPDYGAAKAGIIQLTKYQAVMWAKNNVRVNAVSPGPFPHSGGLHDNKEFTRRLESKVPMGRIGKAQEITGAVVFLASQASSYITGATIPVDGGWTAW